MTIQTQKTPPPIQGMSVIVPVGPGETAWRRLVDDLATLDDSCEIILVGMAEEPAELVKLSHPCPLRWVCSPRGRALQQNRGAAEARQPVLWFLHADSRIPPAAFLALRLALNAAPGAIHFFDLEFAGDGPALTRLNAWGAWFRSRILKLPFGDQGFCLSKELFQELGLFEETAVYGEDHLLIWAARHAGIPVRPVGATIQTSARKYRDRGWLRTTLRHLWLTLRQAIPQLLRRPSRGLHSRREEPGG